MKRFLVSLVTLMMLMPLIAFAQDAAPTAYVSITDDTGALVLAYQPVTVTDADADGALTLCDALMAAHAAYHPEGVNAFLAEATEWGLSLYVLWNVDNGGSFGYMLNDASPLSLLDPIQDGDHVKAYAYTDLTAWSDTYCYFAEPAVAAAKNEEIALTLSAAGFDANWAPVVLPVQGAVITVNGENTQAVTDDNGHAVLALAEAGTYTISAVSGTQTLVPPVCIVTIAE